MNKTLLITSALAAVFLIAGPRSADAAFLDFDPNSVTANTGETFDVEVVIDAGEDQILATDARIIFDSNLLQVDNITDGTYFSVAKKDFSQPGKIYIAGIVDQPGESQTGSGTLAIITFKALADGTGSISYVCNQAETAQDSNIAKDQVNVTDIIACEQNGTVAVTVGAGGTGAGPVQPTPTALPRAGVMDDVVKYAVPGFFLVLLGVGLRLML